MKAVKNFLKPSKRKLIIFAAIIIIAFGAGYFSIGLCKWGCPLWMDIWLAVFWLPVFLLLLEFFEILFYGPGLMILSIILEIVYAYFLSCLIRFVFGRTPSQ